MPLVFGTHVLCPKCDGTGIRAMTKSEQAERNRELRVAKRNRTTAPALRKPSCVNCTGLGYVELDR